MTAVVITGDEWYPVWEVSDEDDPGGLVVRGDVDDATITRWRRVTAEFKQIQDEMESLT